MAQYMDSHVVDAMSATVHLPLAAATVGDATLPPDLEKALSSLSARTPVLAHALDSETTAGTPS